MSRLSLNSTPDKIKHHLQAQGIEVKDVYVFDSKIKGTKSARVRVCLEHREKAKHGNTWPEFTRVQDWIYKPKTLKSKQNGKHDNA